MVSTWPFMTAPRHATSCWNSAKPVELCDIGGCEQRALVTKDWRFADSCLLKREPPLLLLIATGNISNRELEALFRAVE